MNEQTTGEQNVDNNIADYGDLNYEEADTSYDKIESSPVEGYNNFKKTHATEKRINLRFHPYEQPFTVSTANNNMKSKWSFNPFAAYDDSSDEDDKPEANPVEQFMNDTMKPSSSDDNDHSSNKNDESQDGERTVEIKKDVTSKLQSEDTSDFFNLKNSKKASLLSLIQGYREEDIEEDEDTADNFSSSVNDHDGHDTRAPARPSAQQQAANYGNNTLPGYMLKLPEHQPLTWNPVNRGFIKQKTSLSTYKCWKCNRPGHFAEDCTMFINVPAQSTKDPDRYEVPEHYESVNKHGQTQIYTPLLRKMYKRCKKLAQSSEVSCVTCGDRTHLIHCLDCDTTFCDGNGHIAHHLKQFPGHHKLYSFKIRRQVKCSKATCEEMNLYDLWACQDCLLNLFHRHYSMATGQWTERGLKYLANTVCCEEHFEWHRVNCKNAMVDSEHVIELDKLNAGAYNRALNEYLF